MLEMQATHDALWVSLSLCLSLYLSFNTLRTVCFTGVWGTQGKNNFFKKARGREDSSPVKFFPCKKENMRSVPETRVKNKCRGACLLLGGEGERVLGISGQPI